MLVATQTILAMLGPTAPAIQEAALSEAGPLETGLLEIGPPAEPGLLEVLTLAVVQGLTEFLPVSSSGHLTLGRFFLGIQELSGAGLTVLLHAGTLVAVLAVYGRDVLGLIRQFFAGRRRPLLLVLWGSLPAAVVGLSLKDFLESLFERPDVAAGCLFVTAALLLISDRARRRRSTASEDRASDTADLLGGLTLRAGFIIGCAQALAILPGISRSGSTIAAGLLCGMSASAAARYSFLLSLISVGGATVLELPDLIEEGAGSPGLLMAAFAVSAVVGLASLKLLLVALSKGAFPWFAAYCGALATFTLGYLALV